jgi:hypothetical protein
MTYKLRAGAPFDSDNIFNIPPVDAGPIVNPYPDLLIDQIDGGTFVLPTSLPIDGGFIPLAGTATYDPSKTYGPDDIITD